MLLVPGPGLPFEAVGDHADSRQGRLYLLRILT